MDNMNKHQLSVDILNKGLFQLSPTPATLISNESSYFSIYLDVPLKYSINQESIQGNIVIDANKEMKNRDFHIQFIGSCIRYSNNPYKSIQESDRSIIRHQSVSQFVSEILNRDSKRQIDTDTNQQIFLQGSQILRYVGNTSQEEDQEQIVVDILKPGKYNIPFSFYIPEGSPPSIGMIGFSTMFFTIQYKIIIHQFLIQPIVLHKLDKSSEIQQFLCTTLQISLKKYCFLCLGDYCLQAIIRIVFNSLHVKLQFYRKGQKNQNNPLIQQIRVQLISQIVDIGKQTIADQKVKLQQLEYGMKGLDFILCDLNKLKMKSYDNEIFKLRYYLKLEPKPINGISLKIKKSQKLFIEL